MRVKQDELSQVYRDLERLSAERVIRVQELQNRAQELEHQVNRYQQLEARLQAAQADAATSQLQLSVMREKTRHCVQDRRQDLRNMARQLAQLERLLPIQQRGD